MELGETVAAALAPVGRVRMLGRGEFLFLQGDRPGYVYLVLEGWLKVTRLGSEGSESVLHLAGPGEFVGIGTALAEGPLPASACALMGAKVLAVPADKFRRFLLERPAAALDVIRLMARRLHELQQRFHNLSTRRAEARLASLLLSLVGGAADGPVEVALSRAELAGLCGTRLYTVSRVLNGWQRAGIVRLGRRRVTVLRPEMLAELADECRS